MLPHCGLVDRRWKLLQMQFLPTVGGQRPNRAGRQQSSLTWPSAGAVLACVPAGTGTGCSMYLWCVARVDMQGTTTSPPSLKPRYRLGRVTSGLDTGEGEEVLGSSGRRRQGSVWGGPTKSAPPCPVLGHCQQLKPDGSSASDTDKLPEADIRPSCYSAAMLLSIPHAAMTLAA